VKLILKADEHLMNKSKTKLYVSTLKQHEKERMLSNGSIRSMSFFLSSVADTIIAVSH